MESINTQNTAKPAAVAKNVANLPNSNPKTPQDSDSKCREFLKASAQMGALSLGARLSGALSLSLLGSSTLSAKEPAHNIAKTPQT